MYFDFISRINECTKDGNEILLLLSISILLSLANLVVQCIRVIRTRRSGKNPVKYGLRVELQKPTSQNMDLQESDQQNIDLQEANPLNMETQEAVSSDLCLQGAVVQDLGFKEAVTGVEEVQSLFYSSN